MYVTEEERENHFWVCGSTGQGKSKFLERLIKHDIDRLHAEIGKEKKDQKACPVLFIDPTPGGGVVKKILAYCAEIGFNRVLLIDPQQITRQKKVPSINPFNCPRSYITTSVEYLVDAFRVLYEIEDNSRTAVITKYLTSIFTILHYAKLTAHDLRNFTLPLDSDLDDLGEYETNRRRIYRLALKNAEREEFYIKEILEQHIQDLQIGYKNITSFRNDMGTTARRINQITAHPELSLIFGHRNSVQFTNLVADRWLILVNVSSLGTMPGRLLATMVINQYISAVERLRDKPSKNGGHFDIPAYIYLDEASKYATDKLIDVLDTRRNSKIRMILSHQHPEQLRQKGILHSVKANCLTKVAFFMADNDHREDMIRTMYGGELSVQEVSYALSDQAKQTAIFKSGKAKPVKITIPHTPDSKGDVKGYLSRLFGNDWYYTYKQIEDDYADRFKGLSESYIKSIKPAKKADAKPSSKAPVSARVPRKPKEDLPPDSKTPRNDGGRGPIRI